MKRRPRTDRPSIRIRAGAAQRGDDRRFLRRAAAPRAKPARDQQEGLVVDRQHHAAPAGDGFRQSGGELAVARAPVEGQAGAALERGSSTPGAATGWRRRIGRSPASAAQRPDAATIRGGAAAAAEAPIISRSATTSWPQVRPSQRRKASDQQRRCDAGRAARSSSLVTAEPSASEATASATPATAAIKPYSATAAPRRSLRIRRTLHPAAP